MARIYLHPHIAGNPFHVSRIQRATGRAAVIRDRCVELVPATRWPGHQRTRLPGMPGRHEALAQARETVQRSQKIRRLFNAFIRPDNPGPGAA